MIFADRYDAGRRLAALVEPYRSERPVILALPRGGVLVGYEIARALDVPLDILVVRKLGAPGAAEFAIGAIAPGATLLNSDLIERFGIPRDYLAWVIEREAKEMARREKVYRGNRPPLEVEGRTVILVDDGLATGATAQAAVESLRRRRSGQVVFAAPVCSVEGADALRLRADAVVCLQCPGELRSVGEWYRDFSPTSDAEVLECLRQANAPRVSA